MWTPLENFPLHPPPDVLSWLRACFRLIRSSVPGQKRGLRRFPDGSDKNPFQLAERIACDTIADTTKAWTLPTLV